MVQLWLLALRVIGWNLGEYLDSLSCKEMKIDEMQYNLDAVCLAQQIKKKKKKDY